MCDFLLVRHSSSRMRKIRMWRFSADNPSTLSCIICRTGPSYRLKAQVGVIGGVLTGFVTWIHKDLVHRWNLRFPSAGVFAEVLAGKVTGTQIIFPPTDNRWQTTACISRPLTAMFACAAKLGCGAYDARHARVRPSVMQWLLAVRETVVIKPSRLNIVAQGLSNFFPRFLR